MDPALAATPLNVGVASFLLGVGAAMLGVALADWHERRRRRASGTPPEPHELADYGQAENVDLLTRCESTGNPAVNGECPVHRGDACLWHLPNMRANHNDYVSQMYRHEVQIGSLEAEVGRLRARWACARCGGEYPASYTNTNGERCSNCKEIERLNDLFKSLAAGQ